MSKIVKVEVKGLEGEVTLKQPLYMDDVFAIENALDESSDIEPSAFWKRINELTGNESAGVSWSSRTDVIFLKAILKCSEEFNIPGIEKNPTVENFPMTPRAATSGLIKVLWEELQAIYNGETTVPNES